MTRTSTATATASAVIPSDAADDTTLDPRRVGSAIIRVVLIVLCGALGVAANLDRTPPAVRVVVASGQDAQAFEVLDQLSRRGLAPLDRSQQPEPAERAQQPLGPHREVFTPP